jgi:hypothetical protein
MLGWPLTLPRLVVPAVVGQAAFVTLVCLMRGFLAGFLIAG